MSFSKFLTVLSKTLTPVSTYLFFICFVVIYLFQSYINLSFLSWYFNVYCGLPVCFLFIIATNFQHSFLGTTNIFYHNPLWIALLNKFYDPFHCFNWHFFFFYASHVSFQLDMSNHLLGTARTVLYILAEAKICKSFHNFFL